jgi:hypothetical protein
MNTMAAGGGFHQPAAAAASGFFRPPPAGGGGWQPSPQQPFYHSASAPQVMEGYEPTSFAAAAATPSAPPALMPMTANYRADVNNNPLRALGTCKLPAPRNQLSREQAIKAFENNEFELGKIPEDITLAFPAS